MTAYVSLGVSLTITLAVELSAALLWGKRGRSLVFVALCNLLTNPAVVLTALLWRSHALPYYPVVVAVSELTAVWVEGFIYKKSGTGFSRPYLFSLVANALSFGLGLIA